MYGRLTTTYVNFGSVAACDTLDNISLLTIPHTTMYAFPYYDKCEVAVDLAWNPYEGWEAVK